MLRVDCAVPLRDGVTLDGENTPLVPAGSPDADNDTSELKLLTDPTVTVNVVKLLRMTVRSEGLTDTVKRGVVEAVTVTEAATQWLFTGEPPLPQTVKILVPSSVLILVDILKVVGVPPLVGTIGLESKLAVLPVGMFE